MESKLKIIFHGKLWAACLLFCMAGSSAYADINLNVDFNAPTDYTPGTISTGDYTLSISNAGDMDESDVRVLTNFPAGASVTAASCTVVGTGTSCNDRIQNNELDTTASQIARGGGSITWTLTLAFAADMDLATLAASAAITSSDPSQSTTAPASSTLRRVSDLSVSKIAATSDYTPGTAVVGQYTISIRNDGPSDAPGIVFEDTAPSGMTITNWSCTPNSDCPVNNSSGNINQALDIAAGVSLTYTLDVAFASSLQTASLTNEALLTVPAGLNDPDLDDHASAVSLTRAASTDLSLAFALGQPSSYVPGTTGQAVAFRIDNAGPSDAFNASLPLLWTSAVAQAVWSCTPASACTPASGTGDATISVDLAVAANVTLNATLDFDSGARVDLVLNPGISATDGSDNDSANNADTLTLVVERRADIQVTKTASTTTVNPGGSFTYDIRIENLGPSDLGPDPGDPSTVEEVGLFLTDDFPQNLLGDLDACLDVDLPCWEVCASDNAVVGDYDTSNCPTSTVTGNIVDQDEPSDIQDLAIALAAGSATTLRASVRATTGASGDIVNLALVRLSDLATAEVVEATPGGGTDSDDAIVPIQFSSDIFVSKTDGTTTAIAGQPHSYSIRVENSGFVTANNVQVSDPLPLFDLAAFPAQPENAGFIPGTITWQCRSFAGACCNTNSSNCGAVDPTSSIIADVLTSAVDLPGQSHVEYTVSGLLDPRASGTLSNTATLTLEPGLVDPNTANNVAVDDDTLLVSQAALTVEKSLQSLTGVDDLAPFTMVYSIVIENSGPSFVAAADVTDPLSASVFDSTRALATWTCAVISNPGQTACASANGNGPLLTTVDLDPGGSVAFELTVSTSDIATGEVRNDVTVSSAAGTATDFVVTSLIGRAKLIVQNTDNRASIAPGDQVDYIIQVDNEGPDDAFGVRIFDDFPIVIDNLIWSCEASTPIPGDLAFRLLSGAVDTGGNALVASADGRHVYVVGTAADSLFAYARNNTPGTNFGDVVLLETEINGINDGGDSGPVVAGLNNPIDIAMSPDGLNVYVLSIDVDDGPALAAFSRVTNPVAPDFGELTFLGSTAGGVPLQPTALTLSNDNVYVAGTGDPDAVDTNGDPVIDANPLISIFDRDGLTGVPTHDFSQIGSVPVGIDSLIIDQAEDLLLAGGERLAMFAILPAQGGDPAGRLAFLSELVVGDAIGSLALANDAPHLYAKSTAAGTPRLVMIQYLDDNGDPLLQQRFVNTAAEMTLPGGVADPLAGLGGIDIAADGEHLAGVSFDQGVLYTFRRDPVSGGLSFAEAFAYAAPTAGANRGLELAADVVFAPDGRHLLIASAADSEASNPPLAVYSRRAPDPLFAFVEQERNGEFGNIGLQAPNDVAISPDGAHVYSVSLPDNALVRFDRFPQLGLDDASMGMHLQFADAWFDGVGGVQGLQFPRRILISPDGQSLFVTSEEANTLAVFRRNNDSASPAYGDLTYLQTLTQGVAGVDGISGAQGMAMQPVAGAQHLYVAGSFGSSIARFDRNPDGTLSFATAVFGGDVGVSGLSGIRDLAVTADGSQLMGVSTLSNALVVFNRQTNTSPEAGSPEFGELTFVQSQVQSIGVRPVSLAIASDGAHVYVTGQNSNSLAVLRRVTNPTSSAFGQIQPLDLLSNGEEGVEFMTGPRDVIVSPDGKRIYVAAEFSSAVLVFDRDLNPGGARYGFASLVETRRDTVNGVDGIRFVRALTVSNDSRNVYAAGFGDAAMASFRLGVGSVCTAGGSGNIDDRADIGVGGTIVYRASGTVRPDALGEMINIASASMPPTFDAVDPQLGCPLGTDFCATDTTMLVPSGRVSISKVSDQVSVTAGETASYTVTINNAGPSSLIHEPGFPLTVSDLLDANPAFVPGSAVWSCAANGSGNLGFVQAWRNLDPEDNTSGPFTGLTGITGMSLVPSSAGPWLASASVLDDSISVFGRDPVTGDLINQTKVSSGDTLSGQVVTSLDGAQSLQASHDGRFLYVASRVSDSLTVFSMTAGAAGEPVLELVQVVTGLVGLDQAVQLVLSPDTSQQHLYVAGSNDDAIAVFSRDDASGVLSWVESIQQGIGMVSGLTDVSHLLLSGDGANLYALSPTADSITLFDRNLATGELTWVHSYDALDFGVDMDGVSAAVFDHDGRFLYLAALIDNRVLVLERDGSAGNGELVLRSVIEQGVDGANGLVGAGRLAITGDDVHLYVTSESASTIAWYIRDASNGSLTFGGLRGNQSGTQSGLGGATGLVIDNTLNQILVAGTRDAAISQFQRQADSFCPASGSGELVDVPFNIGAGGSVVFSIAVEVAGDATGVIENVALLEAARDSFNPMQSSSESSVIAAEADLMITKDDGLSEIDGLAGAVAIAGTNEHIYTAAAGDNALGVFARSVSPGSPNHGQLEFLQFLRSGVNGVEGLNGTIDVAVSADGAQVYALSPIDNSISSFNRNAVTGELSFFDFQQNGVLGVSGISGASALAFSPDDAHIYVAGGFANAVATFARSSNPAAADFGRLSFIEFDQAGVNGVAGIGEPVALTVAPNGRHVYVIGAESDTLAVFSRNRTASSASFGRLAYVTHYSNNIAGIAGLAGVTDVAISADGAFVYVLGDATGTLARFGRDDVSGELTFIDFKQDGTAGTTGLTGASSMLLDDAGQSLYVAGAASASIVRFDFDSNTGVLSFAEQVSNGDPAPLTGGEVFGLEGVTALMLSPDADHLYAASGGRDALLSFQQSGGMPALDFQQILIDGLGGVAPGVAVEYIIGVENLGPSDVGQARVVDLFPEGFESVQWTCSPVQGSGAQCLASGTGDLDTLVALPTGGRLTFRATGVISAGATGRLINTATVTAVNVSDPDLFNNSATDADTVLSPAADLMISVDDGASIATPGDDVSWDVVVDNVGPSSVRGVFVDDQFPAAVYRSEWSCVAEPAAGILSLPLPADTRAVPAALAISAAGRFAYSVGGNEVEVFRRDPLTGALTQVQRLLAGADGVTDILGARDVVISADGRFVYVAGFDSDAIALFERDSNSGQLEFVDAWRDGLQGIEGLGGVGRLLLSPEGGHLYAAGFLDNSLVTFAIDGSTGALVQIDLLSQGIADVDGLNELRDLAWSTDDSYMFAIAGVNQSLLALSRNSASGVLTPVSILLNDDLLGGSAEGALLGARSVIAVDDEIMVAAQDSELLGRFKLEPADADIPEDQPRLLALGVIDAAALGVALTAPFDLQYDPDQARLYVAASDEVLLINLLGAAPELVESYATSEFSLLTGLSSIVLSPGLRQLYTLGVQTDAEIGAWSRERGSRCPLQGEGRLGRQQVDIVAGGRLLYTIGGRIQANATGDLIYSVSVDNPMAGQEINPADNTATDTDTLVPAPDLDVSKQVSTVPVVAGLPIDWHIDFSNAGLSDANPALLADTLPVFPLDAGGVVAASTIWSCDANVPLSAATSYNTSTELSSIAIGPQGRYVYATSATSNALLVFELQPDSSLSAPVIIADGDPIPGTIDSTISGLGGAADVVVSADGLSVYVAGETSDSVVAFSRTALATALQYRQTFTTTVPPESGSVAGLRGARAVIITADQQHVLVAGSVSNAIAVLGRDTDNGELAYIERVVDGIGTIVPEFNVIRGVQSLHAVNVGNDIYAIAADSEALTRFSLNPETGMLTFETVWRQGDGGIPSLTGLRGMTTAPGDTHLYLLVDEGIVVLRRLDDGSLAFEALFDQFPGLADSIALVVDGSGSRAYVLGHSGGSSIIHVLRRNWADGSLELWFSQAVTGAMPTALVQTAATRQIYLAAETDSLQRFDEQALSRCRDTDGQTDVIDTEVDLGATGWSALEVSATVHPSARGDIINTVAVQPATGLDPVPGNNSSTATAAIEVISDISVTKTGPAEVVAGTQIEYQISVGNAGPSDALGIMVTDVFPVPLSQISWTCNASGGSICPASGTGLLDFQASVLVGNTLDITVLGLVDPAFIGEITNIVLLTPEPGATDPTTPDQRAEWSTDVISRPDVVVTKTTLTTPLVAGLSVDYQLTAVNNGPSNAAVVGLLDDFVDLLEVPSWTCVATAGASCPAAGFGDIDLSIPMPVGSSVTLLVTAELSPAAQGTVVNQFSAEVQLPAVDPDSSNNLAEVVNPIQVRPDVMLDLATSFNPFDPAGPIDLPLLALIENAGPSLARNVDLLINFSVPVTVTSTACSQPNATQARCLLAQLEPGASQSFELMLADLPPAPDTLTVDGAVSSSGNDPDLNNNTDSIVITLDTGIDVVASVANDEVWLAPDQLVEYLIEFDNYGSLDGATVNVVVANPPELLDVEWTCITGATSGCSNSGIGSIADTLVLDSGESVRYQLQGRVDPTLDLSVPQSVMLIADATNVVANNDINPINNIAIEFDQVLQVLTRDGFESVIRQPAQTFETSSACTEVELTAAALSFVEPGRLMIGRTALNDPIFWLEFSRRQQTGWLRFVAIGQAGIIDSGWQSMTRSSASLLLEDRRVALTGLAAGDWHADHPLAAAVARITRVEHDSSAAELLAPAADIIAASCSSAAAASTAGGLE